MLNKNIALDHEPQRVKVEALPEGIRRVAMYDNIHTETAKDEGEKYTVWRADEVVFTCREQLTAEDVARDFDRWWSFGARYDRDTDAAAVENRVRELEAYVDTLSGAIIELAEIIGGGNNG